MTLANLSCPSEIADQRCDSSPKRASLRLRPAGFEPSGTGAGRLSRTKRAMLAMPSTSVMTSSAARHSNRLHQASELASYVPSRDAHVLGVIPVRLPFLTLFASEASSDRVTRLQVSIR